MTLKLNYIIFALATFTAFAVRTAMMLFTIDPLSGFVKPEYASTATFIAFFIVAAAIVVFLSALFVRSKETSSLSISGIPFSVGAILLAVATLYETFFSSMVARTVGLQTTLQYITAIGAAISLLYIAVCKITGREFPRFISIIPVIFWMVRLVVVFTGFSTISTISDTLIETASMCTTLLTLLFYAKVECDQPVKSYKLCFAVAMLNGFICAVGSLPRIVANILSVNQSIHLNTIPTFTSLAVCVFSVIFAYTIMKEIKE